MATKVVATELYVPFGQNYFSNFSVFPNFSFKVNNKDYRLALGIYGPNINSKVNGPIYLNPHELKKFINLNNSNDDSNSQLPPKIYSETWDAVSMNTLEELIVQGVVSMETRRGWGADIQNERSKNTIEELLKVQKKVMDDLKNPGTFAYSRKQLLLKYLDRTIAILVHPVVHSIDKNGQFQWQVDNSKVLGSILFTVADRRKKEWDYNRNPKIELFLPMEDPKDGIINANDPNLWSSSDSALVIEPRHYFYLSREQLDIYLKNMVSKNFIFSDNSKMRTIRNELNQEVTTIISMGVIEFSRYFESIVKLPGYRVKTASYNDEKGIELYKDLFSKRGLYGTSMPDKPIYIDKKYGDSEVIRWFILGGNLEELTRYFYYKARGLTITNFDPLDKYYTTNVEFLRGSQIISRKFNILRLVDFDHSQNQHWTMALREPVDIFGKQYTLLIFKSKDNKNNPVNPLIGDVGISMKYLKNERLYELDLEAMERFVQPYNCETAL
jgi:hypothetical protein